MYILVHIYKVIKILINSIDVGTELIEIERMRPMIFVCNGNPSNVLNLCIFHYRRRMAKNRKTKALKQKLLNMNENLKTVHILPDLCN